MRNKRQVFSHTLLQFLPDSSLKKRRILFLTFLIITLLFGSTITSPPGSKASEIQDKLVQTSNQFFDRFQWSSNTERLDRRSEEYFSSGDRESESSVPAYNFEFVGMWPYGACETSVVDTSRNMALIGNGHALQVLDMSDPSSLSMIGEVELEGHVLDIEISGNYAYTVTSSCLKIVDISDLHNPNEVGSIYTRTDPIQSLAFSSGYAYVAASGSGLIIYDVSDPDSPTFQGTYIHDELHVNDVTIWGNYAICECAYWIPDTNETDWPNGIEVIDVSDPSSPLLAGSYQIWQSYHLQGMAVSEDGDLYICQYSNTDELSVIVVVDVATDPLNPTETGSYFESDRNFEGVALSGNSAYLCDNRNGHLVVLDISTPSSPYFVGECDTIWDFHDIDISGNFVGISHGEGGFSLYDVSNPGSPSPLGNYDTPNASLGRGTNPIVVLGDYVYLACGQDGLRIMDVSDPSNPFVAGTWVGIDSIPSIAVSGKYAYCYRGWPRHYKVIDISSPTNPYLVTEIEFPDDGQPFDIAVRGDYAYVSGVKSISGDYYGYMTVLDISDPSDPEVTGSYVQSTPTFNTGGIAISDNYAYLPLEFWSSASDYRSSLRIIDISDPTDPTEVGSCLSVDTSSDVAVRGDYAYLVGGTFRIIDVSNPGNPEEIFASHWSWGARSVALSGDYAYLGNLRVIDITDPYNPQNVGLYFGDERSNIAVSGNHAYVPGSLLILKNLLAPEVSIVDPSTSSTLHGSVSIEALASHSSGIDKVEFYVDDSMVSFDSTSPYTATWDTTSVADGTYKIRARAYNNNGKSSDTEIVVTVRNYCSLTISSSSGGTTDPDPGTYSSDYLSEVTITAIPDTGYKFTGWTGDVLGGYEKDNPVTIALYADKSVEANFATEEEKSPLSCFIATAAYGSPLHPHLDILRDFRDKHINSTKTGRWLVECYYKYSPSVADFIAKHKALKVGVRIGLLPIVAFSFSLMHLGPVISAALLLFILGFPVFFVFRKENKSKGKEEDRRIIMVDRKHNIYHKPAHFMDWGSKTKRVVFLMLLGVAFIFNSSMTSAPESRMSEIENTIRQSHFNVELVGRWPYGNCEGSAVDTSRDIALIGNGYTLQVLDISNPSMLSKIGELELEGRVQDIVISGNYAYVITLTYFYVVDISDLNNPEEFDHLHFEGSCLQSVVVSSDHAFVAAGFEGILIINVSDPENPIALPGYSQNLHDVHNVAIWGDYAICDCVYRWWDTDSEQWIYEEQVQVINVSDPLSPSWTGTYLAEESYELKGIDVSGNGYVYACLFNETDETSKIGVVDVATNPASPVEVGSYIESDTIFEGVTLTGNYAYVYAGWSSRLIALDISVPSSPSSIGECEVSVSGDFYGLGISGNFVGISHDEGGFSLYDVSDPANPSMLGTYDTPDGAHGRHGNSIVISGDYAYMACGHEGLRIMDVSDPSNPFVVAVCEDVEAVSVAISGRFAYCTAGWPQHFRVVDISTPTNPYQASSLQFPGDSQPFDVVVRGNYAYVSGCNWTAGESRGFLAVVDISNPMNPHIVGSYECPVRSFNSGGIALYGDYAYFVEAWSDFSDLRASLRIIDISDPTDPKEVGSYFAGHVETTTSGPDGFYSHTVSHYWMGTVVPSMEGYEFSPSHRDYENVSSNLEDQDYTATVTSTYVNPQPTDLAPQSRYLFSQETIATENPRQDPPPTISGYVKTEGGVGIEGVTITFLDSYDHISDVVVRGRYAFLAGGSVRIIDVSDPANPIEVLIPPYPIYSNSVALSGNCLYLDNLSLLLLTDLTGVHGRYYGEGGGSIAVSGNHAYVAGSLCILKFVRAPEVSISHPSAWESLHGAVSIDVLASHSSGIDKVEFYIDETLRSTDFTSPYSYTWNTTFAAEDFHRIRAQAYNNDGYSSDSEIEVTVRNQCDLSIFYSTGGTTTPDTGTYSYSFGTEVPITAFPDTGYRFAGWTGDVAEGQENDNPLIITVNSDKSVTANFIKQYTLTLSAETGGTTDPAPGSHTYDVGTEVSITAIPDSDYRFTGWTGDVPGGHENFIPVTITMDSDKSVTANFGAISTDEGEAGPEEKTMPCFIATAAYGSPLHPHLDILRDFRDTYLMPSKFGRLLVKFYYMYSPSVADLITKHRTLKVVVRISLLPLVAFSYSLLHFGSIITAAMPLFIFGLPIFFVLFFRRKMRQKEAESPKVLVSQQEKDFLVN